MKKIKIFLLSLFFVALGTVGAVAGFYVKENPKAVVNWLNNSISVSNDKYKELLEESKLTVLQLNLEIASLEEENAQLQTEKQDLTNRIAELEQGTEADEVLIQEYTTRIEELDAQIVEKDATIQDLQTLISSIYQGLIEDIFVLPEDLKGLTFSVYLDGEDDLLIKFSNNSLYLFDYSEGELSLIASGLHDTAHLKILPNCYLYAKYTNGSRLNLACYNKATKEETIIFKSSAAMSYLDYGNSCFIASSVGLYHFDYETLVSTKSFDDSFGGSSSYSISEYDNRLFVLAVGSSSSYRSGIAILDKETKVGGLVTLDLYYSSSYWKTFYLKGSFYVAVGQFKSSGNTLGLYRINLEDYSVELIYEFISQSNGSVGDFYLNDEIALFGHQKTIYKFDGETVSVLIDSTSNVATSQSANSAVKLGETDTAEYFSTYYYRFKYNKSDKSVTSLNISGNYSSSYNLSDGRAIIALTSGSSYAYMFNPNDETFTPINHVLKDMYFEHEGYLYNYSSSSSAYLVRFDLSTLTKVIVAESVRFTSVKAFDDVLLFYYTSASSSSYILHCPTRTLSLNATKLTYYDSTLSNISERTFYRKLSSLDNGIAYEKIVYNEDFTDYTKTLVLVK